MRNKIRRLRESLNRGSRIPGKIRDRLKDFFYLFTHAHLVREMVSRQERELESRGAEDKDTLLIAFRPTGGFGDFIISAKFLDELMAFAPCRVDIYCSNLAFGKAVYGNRPGCTVKYWDSFVYNNLEGEFCYQYYQYDLTVTVEHFVRIHSFHASRIARIAPALMDKITVYKKGFDSYYCNAGSRNYTEALHIRRCAFSGTDRYTTLRHKNVFRISDKHTTIYFDESYLDRIKELQLFHQKYITINRGADNLGKGRNQTKVWAMESYEALVKLLKKRFPEWMIVQLGSEDNIKIAGVDKYVLGESMESTKWILKNSLLHIDCEGGLVHLATQIGTKCVVLFGPTPQHYYSYAQNCNLSPLVCGDCMGKTENWAYYCIRTGGTAACMNSITPERVLSAVEGCISEREQAVWQSGGQTIALADKAEGKPLLSLQQLLYPIERENTADKFYLAIQAYFSGKQAATIAVVNAGMSQLPWQLKKQGYEVVLFDPFFDSTKEKCSGFIAAALGFGMEARFGSEWQLPYDSDAFECVVYLGECVEGQKWESLEMEVWRLLKKGGLWISSEEYRVK